MIEQIGNEYDPAPGEIRGLNRYDLEHMRDIALGPLFQRGGLGDTLRKIDIEQFTDDRVRKLWAQIDLGLLAEYLCMWSSRYMYLVSVLKTDPAQFKARSLPTHPEEYFVEIVNSGGFVPVSDDHLADPRAISSLNPFCLVGSKRGEFLVMPRMANPRLTETSRVELGSNGAVIQAVNDTNPLRNEAYIRISLSNQSQKAHSCIGVVSSEKYDPWLASNKNPEKFPMVLIDTFYPERNLKPVVDYIGAGRPWYGMFMDWYY